MKISKKIIYSSLSVIVLLFVFTGLSEAVEYKFLVNLPGVSNSGDVESYVGVLYKMSISLATGLAVIMVIWGGVEYMTTDAWGKKENGKERISSALFGLLLALTSYVLLRTIDKNLTDFSLFQTIDDLKDEINNLPALIHSTPQGNYDIEAGKNAPVPDIIDLASDGTNFYNQEGITYFGGMSDIRTDAYGYAVDGSGKRITDAAGNPINVGFVNTNGGVSWNETGSVSGEFLKNYDTNTDFYSAYPLNGRTPAGLPAFPDTGYGNALLANYYLVYETPDKIVRTQIIDRGPGNPNASLDTSKATLNAIGSGSVRVYLEPISAGNTPGVTLK